MDGWALKLRIAGVLSAGVIGLGATALLAPARASPAAAPAADTDVAAQSRALERAAQAVLGVRARAIEGARSVRSLGREREGSGVVITDDGLVLTIGYLVLEADAVELVDDEGRRFPARVVGYDVATGFGLVQPLLPLARTPVPLGDPAALAAGAPLVVMSGGGDGDFSAARLVSRRPFAGYWEYRIDGALYTAPPRRDHAGAGLFNLAGELMGIGSLVVNDAAGAAGGRVPGNLFVPVDLLKPILAELRERGASRASTRPWIGVNCIERDGELRIVRVAADSPADVAGLEPGDTIVAVDGTPVAALDALWQRLWAGGEPAERAVRLDVVRAGEPRQFIVHAVDRAKTLARATGI